MTSEECVEQINILKNLTGYDKENPIVKRMQEALDMAIKALEQEPCEDCISREAVHDLIITWLSDYLLDETREALETIDYKVGDMPSVTPSYNSIKTELKPCEDCISREAVLNKAFNFMDDDCESHKAVYVNDIISLPFVTPQRPKGKWIEIEIDVGEFIYKCTKCEMRVINPYKYCPNCGTRMEV